MSTKILTSAKFAVDFYELTKDQHENPDKYRGWSYGIESLTKALGGIRRNQFILFGGSQKAGKTTLGLNVAAALGKQGVPFLWVSLEMKHDRTAAALFSNIANIERKRFRDIQLDDGDWESLRHSVAEVSKWPGFWNYGATNVLSIRALWEQIKFERDILPQVVFVDYVQLMEDPDYNGSRSQEVAKISRSMKLWTNEEDEVTVVAMAQLNRESIRKGLMDANSFLDSGQLERDMDVGIIMERIQDKNTKQYHPNKRMLKIVGAREAGEADIMVWVDYTKARVTDIAPGQGNDINDVSNQRMNTPTKGQYEK